MVLKSKGNLLLVLQAEAVGVQFLADFSLISFSKGK